MIKKLLADYCSFKWHGLKIVDNKSYKSIKSVSSVHRYEIFSETLD